MKLTELRVEGYRSLVDVTLPLRDLMVMIGPNGSGKTALLEIFLLLRRAAEKQLASQLESLGGLQAVFSRTASKPGRLEIAIEAEIDFSKHHEEMMYYVYLVSRGTGYAILEEALGGTSQAFQSFLYVDAQHKETVDSDYFGEQTPLIKPPSHNVLELALAQVSLEGEAETLRHWLSNTRYFAVLDVGPRSVARLPQSLTPARRPGPNGEGLFSALYNLRIADLGTYNRVSEILQIGFPGFQRLEFPVVGAGQVTLAWYQKELVEPLYPNQLSDGTLRFLWLITALLSHDTPVLMLLDEPEVNLHPELLKLLAGILQDASLRNQVLVATHSPDLIRWLEPQNVLVTEKDEMGATRFTWADTLNLKAWLEEYTLRDLWLMGTLGGRP